MDFQAVFKRYELKYMLTREQKALALEVMEPYMSLDQYGHSTIRNIYYDTDSFRLVRRSIDHPIYKEKLRVRSYKRPEAQELVFVELKKKYRSVVYKRRLSMPMEQATAWLSGNGALAPDTQIGQEIEYCREFYQSLQPAMFLFYEREAFYSKSGDTFRVTFDENILARRTNLSLDTEAQGASIIDPDHVLMEIKTGGGIPLWMIHFLTLAGIHKTSFSKYGTAYQSLVMQDKRGGYHYA